MPVDWKGSLGPNLVGTNPGAYSYRINTNLMYGFDRFNFNLGWRFLPSVWTANKAYENAVIENNARVAAGQPGSTLGYTKTDEIKTSSYNVFSLSATFDLNDTLSFRAGIDNLLDKQPPNIGGTSGVTQAELASYCGTPAAPGCNAGVQRLPRTSLAASAGQFTGTKGYYDVLGRSYFLGVKAKF